MFNTKFNTIDEAKKLNNLTDAHLLSLLKQKMENDNYRTDYNQRKTDLFRKLKSDPVVQKRMAELKKA